MNKRYKAAGNLLTLQQYKVLIVIWRQVPSSIKLAAVLLAVGAIALVINEPVCVPVRAASNARISRSEQNHHGTLLKFNQSAQITRETRECLPRKNQSRYNFYTSSGAQMNRGPEVEYLSSQGATYGKHMVDNNFENDIIQTSLIWQC